MKPAEKNSEQFTGKFYKRLYRSPDNSYCVCLYIDKQTKDSVTVVGPNLPEVTFPITFTGQWTVSEKYGPQFKADMAINQLPDTAKDVIAYIASLKVGIGQKKAQKMIEMVGLDHFWDELEKDPMQFCTIKGIEQRAIFQLQEKIASQVAQQGLFKLFAGDLSCDGRQYKRICLYFGSNMDLILESIKENPFVLLKCGYSFDELDYYSARHTMFPVNDYRRLLAAAQQALLDAKQQSSVGLPQDALIESMDALLSKQGRASMADIAAFLNGATENQAIMFRNGLYYLPRSYKEETEIAETLTALLANPPETISRTDFDSRMKEYAKQKGFFLSADQQNAVWTALTMRFCIITGGPGTGKSTILDALLYCWKHFFDEDWMLMAPSGKASVRMTETTNQPAATIHSSLGLVVGNENTDDVDSVYNPVSASLVVVDEASMIDQTVMADITMSLSGEANGKKTQHLVLVGDPEQLPSVGWGNVLADLIESEVVPVCRLKTIYRQAAGNPIITNAIKMQNGETELDFSCKSFKRYDYGRDALNMEAACTFYLRCVKAYGIENVVLLSPYHKATEISYDALNKRLQEALNPDNGQGQVKAMGKVFRAGDRVMQLKNTDCLSNGDVGVIDHINSNAGESDPCVFVKFENGTQAEYIRENLNQLDLAYATSIHKSQGSQWQTVLIVLPCRFTDFLRRNLLYTAITRSSQNVAIFSPLNTIRRCIANNKKDGRFTNLKLCIQQAVSAMKKTA